MEITDIMYLAVPEYCSGLPLIGEPPHTAMTSTLGVLEPIYNLI